MTQVYDISGNVEKDQNNPLYMKMRRRFSYQGKCTIGEAMIQRAMREGYNPYSAHVSARQNRDCEITASRPLSEDQIKRANSLPRHRDDALIARAATRREEPSRVSDEGVVRAPRGERAPLFPVRTNTASAERANKNTFPLGLIGIIVLCAALLMMLVYSSIQMSNMSRHTESLRSQISSLKNAEAELSAALAEKNDMALIEDLAKNKLGMVRQSSVQHVYLGTYDPDSAQIYDDENSTLIANLLNAFAESFH